MGDGSAVTLRAYEPPSIRDYGSIADHTFNRPPGMCEGNGGNHAPTDVFTKLCVAKRTSAGVFPFVAGARCES